MVIAGSYGQYSVRSDCNGSYPSCFHHGGSLPSKLMVQYGAWFLLNHFAFSISFQGIMSRNLQYIILVHIVRLSAEGYSQQELARMLGVSQKFATQPSH